MRSPGCDTPLLCLTDHTGCKQTVPPAVQPRRAGTILMEVVLALALFMAAGAVVFSGLSASFSAVGSVRRKAQALDLAVTKLSEIQMGQLEAVDDGPNTYEEEDLLDWTWEILTASLEDELLTGAELKQVQIIITHIPSNTVHRLVFLLPDTAADREGFASTEASESEESGA